MTWREFELRLKGYERIQHNEWSKVRILAWKTISIHVDPKKTSGVSLYDWFPIPGDPSKAEIKKITEEQKQREQEEFKKIYDERLSAMKNAGLTHKTA
jgi:hypothetical protein